MLSAARRVLSGAARLTPKPQSWQPAVPATAACQLEARRGYRHWWRVLPEDFELNTGNLVRLSSTGSEARMKVKKFVESMIDHRKDGEDDDLPDMNQVSCFSFLLFFNHNVIEVYFLLLFLCYDYPSSNNPRLR